ncbi:cytochrome c oxidase assembly protein [Candidatus Odyssella thessalonicensis]|uniref:cytochrome c oxidase assembly protein n=1 Tax=Candidatus Odyssella thessalonicensis TaxID=84647 RepID=UPI000225BADD|nr:cytochrome c oxidase assembly protein [Candidatus Odyssella thessalonicensis]
MAARRNNLAIILGFLALGMLGLAFASVPLYRMFCQATGFGGTTKRAISPSAGIRDRIITVRFNANIDSKLSWQFRPKQTQIKVHVGENSMAFYEAYNYSPQPLTGIAIYNVTPDKAGKYFSKIACFCFDEQQLMPRQRVDMPVMFYIDPAFADDPFMDDVQTITLSYTFYKS